MGHPPKGKTPRTVEGLDRTGTVNKHLSKVRYLARRLAARIPEHASITVDDLVSHGFIGLLEAFDHFDDQYGIKFASYAEHRIRGAMLDALRGTDPLGRRHRSLARQADQARSDLAHRHGAAPSAKDVAEQLGVALEQYFSVQESLAAVRHSSLEERDGTKDPGARPQAASSRYHSSGLEVMAGLAREDTNKLLDRALETLPPRQRTIVELVCLKGMQGKDIAVLMNLSKARVSQLLTIARHRLRLAIEQEAREQGLSWQETLEPHTR